MLESSRRIVLVLVPLLTGAWCDCARATGEVTIGPLGWSVALGADVCSGPVCTADGFVRSAGVDYYGPPVQALFAPATEASGAVSSSSSPRSLPAAPRSVLLVLAGFLCVSLVHDHKMWLTLAASVLSVGQHWLHELPQLSFRCAGKEPVERWALPEALAVRAGRVAGCLCYYPLSVESFRGVQRLEVSYAWVASHAAWTRPWPCLTTNTGPTGWAPSPLVFAALARGPPAGPRENASTAFWREGRCAQGPC